MSSVLDVTYELIPDQISRAGLHTYNRYRDGIIYRDRGEYFFETWDIPEIPSFPDDTFHKIEVGEVGRWDLISYRYYKTVHLWWLICVANGIRNPFVLKYAGEVIRIPSLPSLIEVGFFLG